LENFDSMQNTTVKRKPRAAVFRSPHKKGTGDGTQPVGNLNLQHQDLRAESRELLRKLEQSRTRAHIGDVVMVTEGLKWSASEIRFVNDALCRLTGYANDEMVGQPRSILCAERADRKTLEQIDRELDAGNKCGVQLVQHRKDGTAYVAHLCISPVSIIGTRQKVFVCVHRDIKRRKTTNRPSDPSTKELRELTWQWLSAEERERRRLAEVLHDSCGQALFLMRTKLDSLGISGSAAGELATLVEEMGRTINVMIFDLSPPVLRKLGFRAAVRSLPTDMRHRYALTVEVSDDGLDIQLDETLAMVVFRAVRELLINVARHAGTNRAKLSLRMMDDVLEIVVEDHGKGFKRQNTVFEVQPRHFGLFSIRERLLHLGGTLNIQSTPGKGARVTITVPLEPSGF
jgi:PAS domain S-box-containing protein